MSEMLQGCSISLCLPFVCCLLVAAVRAASEPAIGFTDLAEAGAEAHLVDAIERECKEQPYPALQRMIGALEGTLDVLLVGGNRVLDSPMGADRLATPHGAGFTERLIGEGEDEVERR